YLFRKKEYIWRALGIFIVLLDISYLLRNDACFNLSDYDAPMFIYDIYKLILSILFLHFYLKYFLYGRELESYKRLKNITIVGSYIGVFTTVLVLGFYGLIIVPNTTFVKIIFFILVIVSYYAYYTACTADWFDKYIYSGCHTYTSTVNHIVLKDRQYLIVSNLATRWYIKKSKKITLKEKQSVEAASQDPRLNIHVRINESLNDFNSQFSYLNTSQFQDGEEEYLMSTRIVRPDSYYDQLDASAWGKSELSEYPNKLRQYKLIPM
ncbi:PREDICTED: uncharacterized protein LOC107168364, partial [Diuraphis noxia]|uniref:uncharacterized protein LOC107168364 n=1 Tax=Diuraphis noxia TaxID=143948 RepID=UPI00076393C9